MTALLASKGQQLWMRPEVGLPAVQFHGSPAQFAAGWCKACFRGSSHFLLLDPGSLIGHYGVDSFRIQLRIFPEGARHHRPTGNLQAPDLQGRSPASAGHRSIALMGA
jgi:hypothetical protein